MASLPIELFRSIIECINSKDRRTLRSLLLSSRVLNVEAERMLYRNFDDVHKRNTQVSFLRRIVECPRVALLVRSYRLRERVPHDDEYWTLLPKALRAMSNLKHLVFVTMDRKARMSILTRCNFQLDTLEWRTPLLTERDVRAFLKTQSELRVLDVSHFPSNKKASPPPLSMEKLTCLEGHYGLLRLFLQASPQVTHLRWHPDDCDPEEFNVDPFAQSLQNVRFLHFGGFYKRPSLTLIYPYLRNLVFLELIGLCEDDLHIVSRLFCLKALRISAHYGTIVLKMPVEDRVGCAAQLFADSANLESIEIQVHTHALDQHRVYERWTKGSDKPEIRITSEPVGTSEWPMDL